MSRPRTAVTDLTETDYVSALAEFLETDKIIRVPHQLTKSELVALYFREAALLVRDYYVHPSLYVPKLNGRCRPRNEQSPEFKAWFRRAAQASSFKEFQRIGWIRSDERTHLVLVTGDGRKVMDQVAERKRTLL
jgi:ribosomal protein S19E (S16A)